MGNVFKIFFSDIRSIGKNFFAIVIAVAVLIIPALYAWVNIYANWNPYANTGNVKIALATRDVGYTTEDGTPVNKGQEIIEEIAQSTSIDWVIVEDADEAVEAVRAGKYYGALVMNKNLSRNMYDMTAALEDEEPSIIFYQNAKTNAIANKITTTAASTAEHNIQVSYLSLLIENVLEELRGILDDLNGEESLETLIGMLTDLRDSLREYSLAVSSMKLMDDSLMDRLDEVSESVSSMGVSEDVFGSLDSAKGFVSQVEEATMSRLDVVQNALTEFIQRLEALDGQEVSREVLNQLAELAGKVETALQALRDSLPEQGNVPGLDVSSQSIDALIQRIQSIENELKQLADSGSGALSSAVIADLKEGAGAMQALITESLRPGMELIFDGLVRDVEMIYAIMGSVNTTIGDIPPVLGAAKASIGALRGTVGQLRLFLDNAAGAADKILNKVIEFRDSDKLDDLIALLNGDPKEFAEFLSQPVLVESESIYPVENYGSAMTPFYSTLAIWVGGVVLAAIFKVEVEEEGLRRPTPGQLFWGRYLLFFLLSQIQAAIIVWGDLHLLGCQCLEPGLLYLSAAVTSFVFASLIYSLVLAFGDVGKAIVVVVMIVQIAGSSGSYPIEILPPIFARIYLFFPFPYAINAMREAICGLYQYDIVKYLAELSIFGILGLLIGLIVRKPFVGVNRFIEEEMERTGVL